MSKTGAVEKLLAGAYRRLKKDNGQVSLRALAQRMELSPSYLSKVMRGLKPVTPQLLPKIKKVFHLDVIETQSLQRLVLENIESKSLTPRTGLKSLELKTSNLQSYEGLTKKDFLLLEKWFYIPLLNLLTLEDFQSDASWIGKKLGVAASDIEAALKTLARGGYLERQGKVLRLTSLKARFPTDKSHESIRKYHQAMMKRAAEELTRNQSEEDFAHRLINGISFAGDSTKIQQAKAILDQALYEVADLMSQENVDEVFQINLQFFKLTK